MPDGRIPSASEWADPNVTIPNYQVVNPGEGLKPGEVVAASGHVGIYVPLPSSGGQGNLGTISASGIEQKVVHNTWGLRDGGVPTIRRCECDIQ